MRSLVRLVATTTVSFCLVVILAAGARAHAIVISSEPADGGTDAPPNASCCASTAGSRSPSAL